jgi:biopolymer transport protein TolR
MGAPSQRPGGIIDGINVTPLVDITLVLLVIFMVTAKVVVAPAISVDLPKAATGEATQTVFAVTIAPDGGLTVDGASVSASQLRTAAARALAADAELRAVIQADGDVPHRRVMGVLDELRLAGISKVAFATSRVEPASAKPEALAASAR